MAQITNDTVIDSGEQTAAQHRRLAVIQAIEDADAEATEDVPRTVVLGSTGQVREKDGKVAVPAQWFEHPETFWLPMAADALAVDLRSTAYLDATRDLDADGFSAFVEGLTAQDREEASEILAKFDEVEKGDLVVWNGRSNAQPVTKMGGGWFEVEGSRGGHYRFKRGGDGERPYLTNVNSENDYTVDDFEVVGTEA